MPIYTLPTFNLVADAWVAPNAPNLDVADIPNVPVQKYISSRAAFDIQPMELLAWVPPVYLRIDPAFGGLHADVWVWEVPQGSGVYYRARWKDLIHEGFPNEYEMHLLCQCDGDGAELSHNVVQNPPPEE